MRIKMKTRAFVLAAFSVALSSQAWTAPSAEDIFSRSVLVEKVADWRANSTLEIRTAERTRVRAGEAYNLLQPGGSKTYRLFRFNVPADIAGTAFLVHENEPQENDMWMYLPSMAKTRRILAANKHESFMGSDFAYADLMTQLSSAFTHTLAASEPCGNARCYVLESTPKSAKTRDEIGYSKQIAYIREDNFLTQRIRYFDAGANEIKVQDVSDYQLVDKEKNHWIATRREMTTLRTQRKSVLRFDKLQANSGIDPTMLQESRLGR